LKKIRLPIYQKYKIKLKIVIFWRKQGYNTTHSIIDIVHRLKVVLKNILEVFKHFRKQKISPFTFHAFAEYIFLQSFTIKLQFFNFYNFMSAESFIKVQFKSQIKQVLFLLLKEHL